MSTARQIKVLVAPDKFKGTISAASAADAIAAGVLDAANGHDVTVEIDLCPIADGGEGTAEILAFAWSDAQAEWARHAPAVRNLAYLTGPLGSDAGRVQASWWLAPHRQHHGDARAHLPAGNEASVAVFDSASVCGLALVPPALRDPARCSTRGVGELLLHAARAADEVIVGLGGSATVDGGIGLGAALGWRFEDTGGRLFDDPRGANLGRLARVIAPAEGSAGAVLRGRRVRVLCDVSTALLGARGCAAAFGPQKGATPEQVRELDAGLRRLADVTGVPPIERDGAAGGLAYGLRVFAGGLGARVTLESGAAAVLDAVRFNERAARADLVVTGEGRFDATSFDGKAVGEVIVRARGAGVKVLVIAGSVGNRAGDVTAEHLAVCTGDGPPRDAREAMDRLRGASRTGFLRWLDSVRTA